MQARIPPKFMTACSQMQAVPGRKRSPRAINQPKSAHVCLDAPTVIRDARPAACAPCLRCICLEVLIAVQRRHCLVDVQQLAGSRQLVDARARLRSCMGAGAWATAAACAARLLDKSGEKTGSGRNKVHMRRAVRPGTAVTRTRCRRMRHVLQQRERHVSRARQPLPGWQKARKQGRAGGTGCTHLHPRGTAAARLPGQRRPATTTAPPWNAAQPAKQQGWDDVVCFAIGRAKPR